MRSFSEKTCGIAERKLGATDKTFPVNDVIQLRNREQ